jgi:hypothetical protein
MAQQRTARQQRDGEGMSEEGCVHN